MQTRQVEVKCPQCGFIFYVYKSTIKNGNGKYCSKHCYETYRREHPKPRQYSRWLYSRIPHPGKVARKCKECQSNFYVWPSKIKYGGGTFCSNQCRVSFEKKPENNPNWGGGPQEKICLFCGSRYVVDRAQVNRTKYCSQLCHNKGNGKALRGQPMPEYAKIKISGLNSPHWRGGRSKLPWPFAFNTELKRKIRERDGHQCLMCGKKEGYRDGRLHPVHHINFDKMDLREENLITLCASCHSKVTRNPKLLPGSIFMKGEVHV